MLPTLVHPRRRRPHDGRGFPGPVRDIVDRGVAIARDAGFEADALLRVPDRQTAELIAATADDLDSPAVVMGPRGMSGLKSAVLGSVACEVVNAYHRPVVIV
jgi:nucleotide-binding universal stress UspA family protein